MFDDDNDNNDDAGVDYNDGGDDDDDDDDGFMTASRQHVPGDHGHPGGRGAQLCRRSGYRRGLLLQQQRWHSNWNCCLLP